VTKGRSNTFFQSKSFLFLFFKKELLPSFAAGIDLHAGWQDNAVSGTGAATLVRCLSG
jgi:hypothetical protein